MNEAMREMCESMMGRPDAARQLTRGAAVVGVGYVAGRTLLGRVFGLPLVMFAAGVAAGYYGYKHRKEIAVILKKASDTGMDLALNVKESLADLVEEAKEAEESKGHETGTTE